MDEPEIPVANTEAPPTHQAPKKRKSCVTCLIILLVAVVLLGILGFLFYQKLQSSRTELVHFIDTELVPAMQPIDLEKLKAASTDEMIADLESTGSQKLMAAFHERLGPLKSINMDNGQYSFTYKLDNTLGFFSALGTFERATGTLVIKAIKTDDVWKLNNLRIDSRALIP